MKAAIYETHQGAITKQNVKTYSKKTWSLYFSESHWNVL